MRKFPIAFYRANQSLDLVEQKLLDFLGQSRPRDRSRTIEIDPDTIVLLRNIALDPGDDFLLDFSRLRNSDSQMLSDLDGNEECLEFNGKRPADFTVCMYSRKTRILGLHETQAGISASMLSRYWHKLIPGLPKFRFDPVLETHAQEMILKSGAISRFTVALASMGSSKELQASGFTDDEIMRLASYYSAPSFSVTLKAGADSLNLAKIRTLIADLWRLPKKNLKKLSLVAEDDLGDMKVLDLLKDRLIERVETCSKAEETHDSRYRAIREGWGNRKNELLERYIGAE